MANYLDKPGRPKIVCLCGSTRFKETWAAEEGECLILDRGSKYGRTRGL